MTSVCPFIVTCPHCSLEIVIEEVNCRIFRHAVYIKNGEQLPPHSTKAECDEVFRKGMIYGCGKPFLLDSSYNAIVCDYI